MEQKIELSANCPENIRYAAAGDVKTAFELIKLLGSDEFSFEEFEVCFEYNLRENFVLLYEDSEVLGLGVLTVIYPLHHSKKIAEILELVTAENARGKGVGKKLFDAMTELAWQNKCGGIEVASNKIREDAHRFYLREGFNDTHCKLTKKF